MRARLEVEHSLLWRRVAGEKSNAAAPQCSGLPAPLASCCELCSGSTPRSGSGLLQADVRVVRVSPVGGKLAAPMSLRFVAESASISGRMTGEARVRDGNNHGQDLISSPVSVSSVESDLVAKGTGYYRDRATYTCRVEYGSLGELQCWIR